MPRDRRAPLFDILQAESRIQRFIGAREFSAYSSDELIRAAVERQFEIIGEALNQLQRLDANALAGIREHRKIIGFRNLLIHGYAEVDDTVVWSIITEKLPLLLEDVRRLLAQLDSKPAS
jgi:uncharacterized protein with HEPN domain